jgi:hypothetical protein
MPLETVHDVMLAAGNAAFDQARIIANSLAERFEAGEFPGLTPADALKLLAASLPRHAEVDAHRGRPA